VNLNIGGNPQPQEGGERQLSLAEMMRGSRRKPWPQECCKCGQVRNVKYLQNVGMLRGIPQYECRHGCV
jgi:hypothetical protein